MQFYYEISCNETGGFLPKIALFIGLKVGTQCALYKLTLLSRGSPSQLTLLVNPFVHIYIQPIALLAIGYFFICYSPHF
ncbi:hypothetical protein FKN05_09860 [Vibrio sp. 1-1(7)]|nr:hypothetical protein [Vibrio sp. 1-1(7)]NNN72351.1 hypothetical protein [Vibrio sp. 12-2(3-a)]